MKASGISEIKQELSALPPKQVLEMCLKLIRYKKENKELVSYLLFESHDLPGFIENIKIEIDEQFMNLPSSNWYFIKKGLRKILKSITKYGRHTGSSESSIEMLLYFCKKLKWSGLNIRKSQAVLNLYEQQIKKINTLLKTIHDDLQFDYKRQLDELE